MDFVKEHIWLFVNHLGEFRYSYHRPNKFFIYDKEFDHYEQIEKYHGSGYISINYYRCNPDKKIYYWGFEQQNIPETPTSTLKCFEPDVIGNLIPKELINEKYINMTFDDEPIKIYLS